MGRFHAMPQFLDLVPMPPFPGLWRTPWHGELAEGGWAQVLLSQSLRGAQAAAVSA